MALLVDIDSDQTTDNIYNNDNHDPSELSPDSSRHFREDHFSDETWGIYPFKPVAQCDWSSQVASACVAAAAVEVPDYDPGLTSDCRPRVFDYNTRTWLLLDSGAAVSCYPHSAFPHLQPDPNKVLQAVNGATVPTYGTKTIKINLGGRTYAHSFVIAQISEAICGWDFMLDFRLDLQWKSDNKCQLWDKKANRHFPLSMRRVRKQSVGLSLLTDNFI